MICKVCGYENKDTDQFCIECGAKLEKYDLSKRVEVEEKVVEEEPKEIICPSCGYSNKPTFKFCARCGNTLDEDSKKTCQYCGAELDANEQFCPQCGKKQGSPTPTITPSNNQPTTTTTQAAPSTNNVKTNRGLISIISGVVDLGLGYFLYNKFSSMTYWEMWEKDLDESTVEIFTTLGIILMVCAACQIILGIIMYSSNKNK